MAMFHGPQYHGAMRDLRAAKREEAEWRNSEYRKRLAEAAETEEVPAS